ncbi:hypothetical protein CONPUDRAFT_84624 [Coniophora puteana RWD-64-598 SS2]|uniref:CRIB domain-containing protein n=1 Tax=Coniophora puteana (strain RWD-64-598) TaxID=741705 RepID=A0A5M3MBQ1_CONPW|nr:uncharacterized protein CONPUDRAFT_84624 [Coniophora puteana RWD-64-598 SS2]EIW76662.1 hypothetical protein CONPUDRAFT_84624 [Coniophora puteana RWD-64-598 SS2]
MSPTAHKEGKEPEKADEQGDKEISSPWNFKHHYHGSVSMARDGFDGLPPGWDDVVTKGHPRSRPNPNVPLSIAEVDEFGTISKEAADETKSEDVHDELSCVRSLRYQRRARSMAPISPTSRRGESSGRSMTRHFSLRKPKSRNLSTYSIS